MKILACFLALLLGAAGSSAPRTGPGQARPERAQRSAGPSQPVRLAPKFAPGNVLRYQMEFRTATEGHRTGVVEDPQGPSKLELTWGALIRVEVLNVPPAAGQAAPDASARPANPPGATTASVTRLRATYEKSAATARSDTYDPEGAAIEEQYRKLEGRSIEFALDAEGKVGEVSGLLGIFPDEKAASAAREWFGQLAMGASLPPGGILPGQKWSSEQPASSAPIAGLVWRTESTYLRNERCRPAGGAEVPGADPLAGQACAVILTRFEVTQPRPLRDPTPEDYRKRGLRTAGSWSGSGESLAYVMLGSGWVVSITQAGTEEMDVTVSTADGASGVRYAGRVRSQSQITLLPDSLAAPAPR